MLHGGAFFTASVWASTKVVPSLPIPKPWLWAIASADRPRAWPRPLARLRRESPSPEPEDTGLARFCPGCGALVRWPADGSSEQRCDECETVLVESVGELDVELAVQQRLYRKARETLDVRRVV